MIAFDLDGTLFEQVLAPNWEDGEDILSKSVERPGARAAIQEVARSGRPLRFVTNRSQVVASATDTQLNELTGLAWPVVYTRPEWMHWGSAREYKAMVLRGLGQGVYVGDQDCDRLAAEDAGWMFVHADDWLLYPLSLYDLEVIHG